MAEGTHKAKLLEGVVAWNAWRAAHPEIVPDLRGLSLSLSERQLGPTQGGPINLTNTQLGGADLPFSTLIGANFQGAALTGANFREARLSEADFSAAELIDVNFEGAELQEARFDGAVLSGADLRGAKGLTQDQIEAASGDDATELPEHLTRPLSWRPLETASKIDLEEPLDLEQFEILQVSVTIPDLYQFLNIPRTASPEAIRKAFIRAAKTYHPDRHPGDREAEETFKALTVGVDILLDPERREQYDRGEIDASGNPNVVYNLAQPRWMTYAVRFSALVIVVCASIAGYWVYRDKVTVAAVVEKIQERAMPQRVKKKAPAVALRSASRDDKKDDSQLPVVQPPVLAPVSSQPKEPEPAQPRMSYEAPMIPAPEKEAEASITPSIKTWQVIFRVQHRHQDFSAAPGLTWYSASPKAVTLSPMRSLEASLNEAERSDPSDAGNVADMMPKLSALQASNSAHTSVVSLPSSKVAPSGIEPQSSFERADGSH